MSATGNFRSWYYGTDDISDSFFLLISSYSRIYFYETLICKLFWPLDLVGYRSLCTIMFLFIILIQRRHVKVQSLYWRDQSKTAPKKPPIGNANTASTGRWYHLGIVPSSCQMSSYLIFIIGEAYTLIGDIIEKLIALPLLMYLLSICLHR